MMRDKPQHAAQYHGAQTDLVRATCLYIATKLGDLMEDLVIVGGLVPSLIVDQTTLPQGADAHVGTMDLDVGLQLALLDEGRYRKLTERLRDAGFSMDKSTDGNPTRQRWVISQPSTVAVDFLIPPSHESDQPGKLRNIEPNFAAIIAPGLRCAFRDRQQITICGRTLFGEKAERSIWVCGAGAFVVLKALAFDGRGENKDAYDLFYVIRNYGAGVEDVALKIRPLLDDAEAQRAIAILKRDFTDPDGIGPMRVATFLAGEPDVDMQADVVGFVRALLTHCHQQ
ncbi:MAG: hypothetical protein M0R76_13335 [Proteobacteria bacterium]|nr:hypothetical protein [Pseudomonadota bacterium]